MLLVCHAVDYKPILRVEARDTEWVTWGEFVERGSLLSFASRLRRGGYGVFPLNESNLF